MVVGVIVMVKYWGSFRVQARSIAPYTLLGCVLLLLTAALNTGREATLDENIRLISINLVQLIRDSVLAVAGLVLFDVIGALKPLQRWEEGFKFTKEVPVGYLFGVIAGYAVYSILLFNYLTPEVFSNKTKGFFGFMTVLSMSSVRALDEELLFRLFLIGLVVFLMKNSEYRWIGAITVSAVIWSYSHWFVLGLGSVKFVHILPFGVVLGYTLKKFGFEMCVFLHITVNIVNGTIFQFV